MTKRAGWTREQIAAAQRVGQLLAELSAEKPPAAAPPPTEQPRRRTRIRRQHEQEP